MRPRYLGCWLYHENAYGRGLAEGVAEFVREHPVYRAVLYNRWDLPTGDLCGVLARLYLPEERRACDRLGLPTVIVSNNDVNAGLPSVHVDDRAVGIQAAEYYVRKGFRHLAAVGSLNPGTSPGQRLQGFRERGQALGATVALCEPGTGQDLTSFLRRQPRPLGVLGWHDAVARRVLEIAWTEGWVVPHEMAVLGVDNDYLECALAPVELSSVDLGLRDIGRRACARLVAQIESASPVAGSPPQEEILPPVGIVERASTDTLAFADPAMARAMACIRQRAYADLDVATVARASGLCRRALERRFRTYTGHTIREEIAHTRLDRAVNLLRTTRRPILEISESCGFPDYRRFRQEFHRRFGVPPRDYRQPHRPPPPVLPAPPGGG